MADRFTNVTVTGYGGRIMNSIKGVLIGFIFFIFSFGLLYWNEGRVNLSEIASSATKIDSATISPDPSLSGKLVSVTGIVNSDQIIGDNLFLNPDKFIAVKREVEMYSWKEKKESRSTTSAGGTETTETTYIYSEGWEEQPQSSSGFKHPEEHENPQKGLDSQTNKVISATIGSYGFNAQNVALPELSPITLNPQNTTLDNDAVLINKNHIFIRKSEDGTFDKPKIGDLRISYHALLPGFEGTLFGKLNGSKIDSYLDKDGNSFYRMFVGTHDQSVATLQTEYLMMLWIFRVIGFLLMWLGLSALFGPISVLLDILPIFGSISRFLIGLTAFIVSLVLTIVTILMSMIVHNVIATVIAIAIAIGAIIFSFTIWKNKKKAAGTTETETNPIQTAPSADALAYYVKEARARGGTDDQIRQALLASGWSEEDVMRALRA